jgi:hypothetical protein
MSDILANPNDAAIETLRERERQFLAERVDLVRRTEVVDSGLELVRDLIATLSRKPRARRPRAVEAADAAPESAGPDPLAAFRVEAA